MSSQNENIIDFEPIQLMIVQTKKSPIMKNSIIYFVAILIFSSCNTSTAQPRPTLVPLPINKKVQVAILFDTSNSMDGLIDQAKTRIWGIINEVNSLRYEGQVPKIEIALYEYGKSTLSIKQDYVRKILDLSSDLDVMSQQLFGLTTNGGDEFCGAVIKHSLNELEWSDDPSDLKLIYIAGNEPFNQGPVSYKEVCSDAKAKGIFINTIYCGDYDQGVREFWKDGATCSTGDYFNINSDAKIVHIDTPYDDKIGLYNDSLNGTYYGYGNQGRMKKEMQFSQDANAASQSSSSKAERASVKASVNYTNSSWDIVDAIEAKDVDITTLKEEELPAELKGKTEKEKLKFIEDAKANRENYQKNIQELSVQRQKFIDEELKTRSTETEIDDFGTSVNESIRKAATQNGYETKK